VVLDDQSNQNGGERSVRASPQAPGTASERPSIGLALGSGGARGFAHIGVIRTLLEHNIVPDIIVGTSIGAVVGGCQAAGRLDLLEEWAVGLTRRGILSYLDISFSGSGLIGGDRLASRLQEKLGDITIETLPIRFAAVTTEIDTGHEIWLTRGRLADALRASYALPGIFPAVAMAGRWLVDGALVNPVPVSAARVLGARIVIAVNLSFDVLGRGTIMAGDSLPPVDGTTRQHEPQESGGLRALFGAERAIKRQFTGNGRRPGIPTVMADAFNIMQDRITRARLAGDPPDVSINPRVGQVGWFDFHRAGESIEAGAKATERELELIDEAISTLAPRSSS
jgi:NTE family protein